MNSEMTGPKKLIRKCGLSSGDIVMLSAAVGDLHRTYSGQYLTDLRTSVPELWDHNPYVTRLADLDPEALGIDCAYPLIDQCNTLPVHCLHGFARFLSETLGLKIEPTEFRGDIHLRDTGLAA